MAPIMFWSIGHKENSRGCFFLPERNSHHCIHWAGNYACFVWRWLVSTFLNGHHMLSTIIAEGPQKWQFFVTLAGCQPFTQPSDFFCGLQNSFQLAQWNNYPHQKHIKDLKKSKWTPNGPLCTRVFWWWSLKSRRKNESLEVNGMHIRFRSNNVDPLFCL